MNESVGVMGDVAFGGGCSALSRGPAAGIWELTYIWGPAAAVSPEPYDSARTHQLGEKE
jgi:hypothetical protein